MYDIAFIMGSKTRKSILLAVNHPKTPKMLSKELDKHINSIGRALREMEKKKFVACLNPKDTRNRFYQITKEGKRILKKVKEIEGYTKSG